MRELEAAQTRQWSSTKDTRKDLPFVRAAKAGGWKTELHAASVEELERTWGPLMKWLGYELTTMYAKEPRMAELQKSLLGERIS
jgi:hypothetical protein